MRKKIALLIVVFLFAIASNVKSQTLEVDRNITVSINEDNLHFYHPNSIIFSDPNNIEIFIFKYNCEVWVNPNIPISDIAKEMFKILSYNFQFELDECKKENELLKMFKLLNDQLKFQVNGYKKLNEQLIERIKGLEKTNIYYDTNNYLSYIPLQSLGLKDTRLNIEGSSFGPTLPPLYIQQSNPVDLAIKPPSP